MTPDVEWDPSSLDHDLDGDEHWYDAISDIEQDPTTNLFDEFGDYRKRVIVQDTKVMTTPCGPPPYLFDALEDSLHEDHHDNLVAQCVYKAHSRKIVPKEPEYGALNRFSHIHPRIASRKHLVLDNRH